MGALLAAAGVTLGAFGAHALKARLGAHALGMMLVGLSAALVPDGAWLRASGLLLLAGVVLFSGSLYGLALGAPRWLGAVTPFGGAAFILGWLAFAAAAART